MSAGRLQGATLGEALENLARECPDVAVHFPSSGAMLTAAELEQRSARFARVLIGGDVRPDDVVGLLVAPTVAFLVGLFGILRAGATATVLPLPGGFADAGRVTARLSRFVSTVAMHHLVVDTPCRSAADLLMALHPELRVWQADSLGEDGPACTLPQMAPGDLAFVQFTSGSTTEPKGVMLTHHAVLFGLRASFDSAGLTTDDVLVQWVPHFHDMGLVGSLAQLLNGGAVHIFAPVGFLRRPAQFLRYFADRGGTVFSGPNFAYDLLLNSVSPADVAALDLSRWRVAFNGAEPVSASTVRNFYETLAPAGVGPCVMYPVYGMAEATLPVTFPEPGSVPYVLTVDGQELASSGIAHPVDPCHRRARVFVSVGRPVKGMRLRIVDDRGAPCPEGRLGEIHIRGDAVTSGYYRDAAATSHAFDGAWLRTGDLGFTIGDHLFVAGRRKEMAIVYGRNYFPQDAETVAHSIPGVHRRRCVAFAESDEDGAEWLSLVVEAASSVADRAALAEEVRAAVSAALELGAVRVRVVDPRWLTRTTSGKWQRLWAKQRITKRT